MIKSKLSSFKIVSTLKQLNLTKKEDVVPIFFDEISRLVPKLARPSGRLTLSASLLDRGGTSVLKSGQNAIKTDRSSLINQSVGYS